MSGVETAIATFLTPALGASAATAVAGFSTKLLVSVASSALMQALQPTPDRDRERPGLVSQYAQTGATNPLTFPLGTTASAGTRLAPRLSHGKASGRPRAYLTLAIAVAAVPGCALSRVAVNGEWVELGGPVHPDYGQPCLAVYKDYFWIKWRDGSQTAAEPMMLDKYGSDPDYPWSADMVGGGMGIAYLTFRYNDELYNALPRVVIETTGIPLYDPRLDDTMGGTGAHRWDDPATWEPSDNPQVQAYNVCRGITLFTGDVWGGGFAAWRLPLDNWTAAMNLCDTDQDGVPRYRAGYEVRVDQKPAAVLKELAKASAGAFAQSAGRLKTRVDGPGLPVMTIEDGDFFVNQEQTEVPFASPSKTWNGARSSYPEPEAIYASEDAPVLTFPEFEAEDAGQRQLASLQFHAVPYGEQVQRLQYGLVLDNRRQRRHSGTLQGAADLLEPLDAIGWNSERYNYGGKQFDVAEVARDPRAATARVSLKEVDSSDWTPPAGAILPRTPPVPGLTAPDPLELQGVYVFQTTVTDSTGLPRRAGVGAGWSTDDLEGVDGVQWKIMDSGGGVIFQGAEVPAATGSFSRTEGIIPGRTYWIRLRPIAEVPTAWSDPLKITAPAVLLTQADFDPSVTDYVERIAAGTLAPLDLENMNVVERIDLHPDWTGTTAFDGTAGSTDIRNGHLYITPGAADQTVTHTDAVTHDLGGVFQSRVTAALGSMFWNVNHTWDTWGTWDTVDTWAGNIEGCAARVEVRHTQDDPAGSPSWSDWAKPGARLITARAYQVRVVATFGATDHRLRLTRATIVIDVPDRIVAAEDLAIPVEGLTYDFDPPFMDRPAVSVTPENIADGVRVVVTGKSAAGVTIRLLDGSDTGQAGTVDLLAKGFGRQT